MAPHIYGTYPRYTHQFNDLTRIIEETILPDYLPTHPLIAANSIVRTQGSCFAQNVGDALRSRGIRVSTLTITEGANSPLANRSLFEYVLDSGRPYAHPIHEGAFPQKTRELLRREITTETLFIFTVGVSATWFEKSTGIATFDWEGDVSAYDQKFQTVEENEECFRFIVDSLRMINPNIHVVLTLSPVPLNRVFGRRSVMAADCLSKSILRVAIDRYMAHAPEGVYYWPSFEIVRWLGAHLPPVFGADDQMTRHVNKDLVELIVDLFLKYYAEPGLLKV